MADLTFYTHPMSRGRVARWMLEEVGEPYDTVLLDYGTSMKGADYLAINPMGKVPAIKHGDTIVTETAAICAYLADAFPKAGLAPPPGDPARGPYYRWMFFTAGPVEAAITDKALKAEVGEEQEEPWSAMAASRRRSTISNAAIKPGPYILGDRFSAADVYVGSQIGWGMMFGTIDARPAFYRLFRAAADPPRRDPRARTRRRADAEERGRLHDDRHPRRRDRLVRPLHARGHGRRSFMAELTRIAGSAAAANALLLGIAASPAAAAITPDNDPRLAITRGPLGIPGDKINGYIAAPKALKGKRGVVIVVHENRGLNAISRMSRAARRSPAISRSRPIS